MEIKAKKSLGQNFLKDEEIITEILQVAEVGPEDHVFEIGPGTGVLTEKLLGKVAHVFAVELDHQLVKRLEEHFKESQGFSILEGNVLEINLNEVLAQAGCQNGQYKVIANIPYYITAPIIRTLLSLRLRPKSLTLMVQKEVAERMTAKPGDMSLLSLMVQYYSDARIAILVPREAFDPVPAVESAVVQLIPKRSFDPVADRKIFRFARAGFAARRKTLVNNLTSSFHLSREQLLKVLECMELPNDIRAQALSVEDWERLAAELAPLLDEETLS
jgi:16S rRNA (adenine1518-N6/adenine1519-N6)-dimethyltransferase